MTEAEWLMPEAEWLTTERPTHLIASGLAVWDERKAFLAGSHCLRHWWHLLTDLQKQYVVLVEGLAEGEGNAEKAQSLWFDLAVEANSPGFFGNPTMAYADCVVRSFSLPLSRESLCEIFRQIVGMTPATSDAERAWQCWLIREVFGNPFRPVRAEPAWLTSDVLALARGIYEDKAFDRMPILADALQDAGCDNVNVLDHCREQREHVRGCWVIDMLLGKG